MSIATHSARLVRAAIIANDVVEAELGDDATPRRIEVVASWALRAWIAGKPRAEGHDPRRPSTLLDAAETARAAIVEAEGGRHCPPGIMPIREDTPS